MLTEAPLSQDDAVELPGVTRQGNRVLVAWGSSPAIWIEGVAEYRLMADGLNWNCRPDSTVSEAQTREWLLRVVLPLAATYRGQALIHASSVVGPDGVTAFCGVSGVGKSSLAGELPLCGFRRWSDDVTVISTQAGGAVSHWLPHPLEPVGPTDERQPLSKILLLKRGPGTRFRIGPPLGSKGFRELLKHAGLFGDEYASRLRPNLRDLLAVTAAVPVQWLSMPDWSRRDPEALRELADWLLC